MRKQAKIDKQMREIKNKAFDFEVNSRKALDSAYLNLVKVAKANGITVEELLEQRKKRK